ncbi:MAG: hypothetical protein DRI69_09245 [Bacteroidetes bacterium]|nr:MAG: hypothetical protein DRI69_09245 [Bacteroidota bacterium]
MQKFFLIIGLALSIVLLNASPALSQQSCTPSCQLEKSYFVFVEGNPSPVVYLNFDNADYAEFDIWSLNAKLNGPPSNRYIDVITVFVNDEEFARYSGDSVSAVTVKICDRVIYSIRAEYSNGIVGSDALGGASIGKVSYCGTLLNDCAVDSDNDGVCDPDDPCPYDFDNQCQPPGCVPVTRDFATNPLEHSGRGSSSVVLNYGATHQDISFTISDLNSHVTGSRDSSYIESVKIYADGTLQSTFTASGEDPESVQVNIDEASLIEVRLSNASHRDRGSMSVELSEVTSCNPWSSSLVASSDGTSQVNDDVLQVYPNPSSGVVNVTFESYQEVADIGIYDVLGRQLFNQRVENTNTAVIDIPNASAHQMVFIIVKLSDKQVAPFKLLLTN